jgi:hypothetical protein
MGTVLGIVLICAVVLATLVVSGLIRGFAEKEIAENLSTGSASFHRFLDLRFELLRDRTESLAQAPYLKATMSIPDLDPETALASARDLQEFSGTPMVLLFDASGNLLADASGTNERVTGPHLPGISSALNG